MSDPPPAEGAHIAWSTGGHARLVRLEGDLVSVVSTVSSPPGSRPSGKLVEDPRDAVRMKVHGCRAEGDGTFRIDGRLLDATRAVRARLVGLIAPG